MVDTFNFDAILCCGMWRWIHRIDIIHEWGFLSLCDGELGTKYAHLAQNYYSSAINFKSIMPTWAHFPCKLVCNGWRCLFKWCLHKSSRRKLHRKNHFHKINRQTNSTSTMNRTQCFPLFECRSRHDSESPDTQRQQQEQTFVNEQVTW